jgi:hypothetical protein
LHWFEGTATGFKARKDIPEEGDPKDMNRSANATTFFDWNKDGLVDLTVGSVFGGVYMNLNKGTRKGPAFGKREPVLMADGKPVKVSGKSFPVVADWDGDKTPDLLVGGEEGQIFLFKGLGNATFDKPVALEAGSKPIKLGYRTKFCLADWNGDKLTDIIVGDAETVGGKTSGFVYLILQKKQ